MNNCQTAFRVSLFAAMTVMFISLTHAQATRTWVSGVGDDVNRVVLESFLEELSVLDVEAGTSHPS